MKIRFPGDNSVISAILKHKHRTQYPARTPDTTQVGFQKINHARFVCNWTSLWLGSNFTVTFHYETNASLFLTLTQKARPHVWIREA